MVFTTYADAQDTLYGISIISCGHIFAKPGRTIIREKGRNDYLLFYVAKGSETFYLDRETIAEEGSFIFYRPDEKQHHSHTSDKTGEFYYIHFNAPEDFDLFTFESSKVYFAKPSSRVRDLFEEIINEVQMKQQCYEKICISKLLNIGYLLQRNVMNINSPHREYMGKIAYVVQVMNREYNKDYSLDDYADMCNMSKFHFLRIFENITGFTPVEYRNRIRIEHAKEFLEDSCIPVGEISAKLGYASPAYFCDAFKRKVGMSPKQYRERLSK